MTNNEAVSILTEWVDNGTHDFIHEAVQMAIKALEEQKPDQNHTPQIPESDKLWSKTGETCTDTISRQAAIDALDKIFPADPMRNDYTQGITCGAALATEYIKQLPSAQPEITPDGTLNVSIDADIANVGRILLSQAGTQRGGLYYKDEEPEIIHCAECKWLQCNMRQDGTLPKGVDEFECRHWCGYCDPMDFCSRAERRTDGSV